MANLILTAPLDGWALPLAEIPDPVFAQGLAGDGLAIDPTGNVLHAPCAGRVAFVGGFRHALNLKTEQGVELLLHVGIDTVALAGAGFEALVTDGEMVASGQALLRFDLDRVVRRVPSAITPILVVAGGRVLRFDSERRVAVGDVVMEIAIDATNSIDASAGNAAEERNDDVPSVSRMLAVRFDHGLHARPASQLVAALRPFIAQVSLQARGGRANVRSAVALMGLGVQRDEIVEVVAVGADAEAAMAAVAMLLSSVAVAPAQAPARSGGIPKTLAGLVASRGLALGPAVFLQREVIDVAETAADPGRESARLAAAIAQVHAQISASAESRQGAQRSILEAHAELVLDPELHALSQQQIAGGSSAGHGWRLAIAASARTLGMLGDARMRERIADLRDIEHQVLGVLAGRPTGARLDLPENAILLAEELLPSQLLGLDRERIAGICTASGGPTSHLAIMAAAMGIPTLVAVGAQVLDIPADCVVLLDAERGFIQPAPDAEEQARIAGMLARQRTQSAADLATANASSLTRDGVHVRVCANLGAAEEAGDAVTRGADGCGLLRTEFLFQQRQTPPSEDEQFEEYRAIRDSLAPRPLTIRTMDIGGDKPIAYLPMPAEENPALGLRGVRTSLARPDLLRTQLRAILRMDSPSSCRIMLPMVTDVGDLHAVRAILQECADELAIVDLPKLGAMVETPASALLAEQLLTAAEFLSIGTNDLSQYVLAMDRGQASLAARLDALHPAVLRLIESVAAAGRAASRDVSVCGGLGSDPEAIPILIGLGIREVSAVPRAIPQIKRIIRSLDVPACRELASEALALTDAAAVRRLVADWSTRHSLGA